jgi:hypothetical protein
VFLGVCSDSFVRQCSRNAQQTLIILLLLLPAENVYDLRLVSGSNHDLKTAYPGGWLFVFFVSGRAGWSRELYSLCARFESRQGH